MLLLYFCAAIQMQTDPMLNVYEQICVKAKPDQKACIGAALRVGKHNLSLENYSHELEFLRSFDVKCPSKNNKASLHSTGVGRGFIKAISRVLIEDQRAQILSSPFYSIKFDASDNNNKKKVLSVYIRFIRDKKPVTEFIKLIDIPTYHHGVIIASMVLDLINDLGLDLCKCVLVAVDGTNSNVGKRLGAAKLLLKYLPFAFMHHCICHDSVLGVKGAFHVIALQLDKDIANIINSFKNSNLKNNLYDEMVKLLTDGDSGPRLKTAIDIRWLSRGQVISTITSHYSNLMWYLHRL